MLPKAARDALIIGADRLDVRLADAHVAALERFVELLVEWNRKIDLTAVTEPQAIVDKHLLDSLAVVPLLRGTRILDVGTGAGLPSIVLAIVRPDLSLTAIESLQKRVTFVRHVSRELRLPIVVEPVRLEQRAPEPIFDTAVSRATFEPAEWVERGAPFVKPGGRILAMLSAKQTVPDPPPGFVTGPTAEHVIGDAPRRIISFDHAADQS